MGSNANYNQGAIEAYQEAMPGYEIVPVYNNDYNISWQNTDALHCRARGVMDFGMLFVDHRNVLYGEQSWQDSIAVTSKFIAYSGAALKTDSLLVYYSIDGGAYQAAHMTATGNPDEYVGYIKGYQGESEIDYYVFGADESGHRYTQPVFAGLDPHHFTMEAHEPAADQALTLNAGWNWWSTCLDIDLAELKAALGASGRHISGQADGFISYSPSSGWTGNLQPLTPGRMYKIHVVEAVSATLSGSQLNPADCAITIAPGNNWIGYPLAVSMSLNGAFAGANPVNGDQVNSYAGTAMYQDGTWYGTLQNLEPGQGYIYKSNATGTKTFTFPTIP